MDDKNKSDKECFAFGDKKVCCKDDVCEEQEE